MNYPKINEEKVYTIYALHKENIFPWIKTYNGYRNYVVRNMDRLNATIICGSDHYEGKGYMKYEIKGKDLKKFYKQGLHIKKDSPKEKAKTLGESKKNI